MKKKEEKWVLKAGMEKIQWDKVKGRQGYHGRCTIEGCSCPAIYMKKSRNRWGDYYRIYCRYCAHVTIDIS